MKLHCRLWLIMLCLFVATPLLAATIKKKDGQVLEGEIKGLLVVKSNLTVPGDETTPIYYLMNGKDISVIDEEGVHLREGSPGGSATVTASGVRPTDEEVLATVTPTDKEVRGLTFLSLPNGGEVLLLAYPESIDGKPTQARTHTGNLLGTVLFEGDIRKNLPFIQVTTRSGLVLLATEDVVEFKQEADKPTGEKKN